MTICLNMIVKDEAHVIERCLDSCLPLIDTFCILDTGSTDKTVEVIREWGKKNNIEGVVFETTWTDFGTTRSEAIDLAKGRADYLLFIDADDIFEYDEGFVKPELDGDAYNVVIDYGGLIYTRLALVKDSLDWRYEGVLHEYVTCDQEFKPQTVGGFRMKIVGGGARDALDERKKYAADAEVLRKALKTDPNNARYAFYFAQSLRDSGQYMLAHKAYEKRSKMGGFDQEVWFSKFQMAKMGEVLGWKFERVQNLYLEAYNERPWRAEPLVHLAALCRVNEKWGSALVFSQSAIPIPVSKDSLFVDVACHTWKPLDEYSIAAFYCGLYDECARFCKALLAFDGLPDTERQRIETNLKFALDNAK